MYQVQGWCFQIMGQLFSALDCFQKWGVSKISVFPKSLGGGVIPVPDCASGCRGSEQGAL